MAPKIPPKAEKDTAERWLLTYADLITLLLIFFIVMYVMSIQDIVKFKSVSQSLNQALQGGGKELLGDSPGPSIIPGQGESSPKYNKEKTKTTSKEKMAEIKKKIEEIAKKAGLEKSISVKEEERGIVISILDKALFNSGEAVLNPPAHELLRTIAGTLSETSEYLRVEGHTDNAPINTPLFPSNWELSGARAASVVRLFVEEAGIIPGRLSAVGYGEYRPLADNSTEEGRSKNRRVEIVLMNSAYNKSEAGESEEVVERVNPAASLVLKKKPHDGVPAQVLEDIHAAPPANPEKPPAEHRSEFKDDFFEKELGGGR